MSVVFEVARWAEVFETSESRKCKTLNWISERVDFTSTGWQQGLDDFGPVEWLAVYGAWMVIVRTSATAKFRGRLCGDKGEPWSVGRIARPSGVAPELIAKALEWALKVGWLVAVEYSPGESPGVIPTRREKPVPTGHDITGQDTTERNGTEPPEPAEPPEPTGPGRAVELNSSESQSAASDQPAAVKLHQLAKASPLLQHLERVPVTGSGKMWHGSIFGHDKLKPAFVTDKPEAFWLEWYRDQLTSGSPELRCGNAAEAVFSLAAVYAARRVPESSLKKSPRIALWISWIKSRECKAITAADFQRAAEAAAKAFGFDLPTAAAASPISQPPAATAPPRLDPAERAKPKGCSLKHLREQLATTRAAESRELVTAQ